MVDLEVVTVVLTIGGTVVITVDRFVGNSVFETIEDVLMSVMNVLYGFEVF